MKMFNHKKVLNLIYRATTQLSVDPQDRGIPPKMIKQIVEILHDCNCETCQKVSKGFELADLFIRMGDFQSATMALTIGCESLGLLAIPALKVSLN